MNSAAFERLKPFISVMLAIVTLLAVCFFKMEIRRTGYSVLRLAREERRTHDWQRQQTIRLAKITRPERVQAVAQNRLTLKRAESGQIIQMTEQGIALKQ